MKKYIKFVCLTILGTTVLTSCDLFAKPNTNVSIDLTFNGNVRSFYDVYNYQEDNETTSNTLVLDKTSPINPFGTFFSNNKLYLFKYDENGNVVNFEKTSSDVSKVQSSYTQTIFNYHVLFDRHYFYRNAETQKVENLTIDDMIVNLKVLNTKITPYGETGEFIKINPVLYQGIKDGYEFTINSENNFSIFIGNLADINDAMIDKAKSVSLYGEYVEKETEGSTSTTYVNVPSPYQYLAYTNNRYFYKKADEAELNKALICTPSLDELLTAENENKPLIEFDDKTYSIRINNTKRCQEASGTLNISLSGSGKGLAIEKFFDDNSEYVFLLNGGSSSIKTNNTKINSPWNIAFTNPLSKELISNGLVDSDNSSKVITFSNSYEVIRKIDSEFNLSTSGYYENYYYIPLDESNNEVDFLNFAEYIAKGKLTDEELEKFNNLFSQIKNVKRVNHIINPNTGESNEFFDFVSVFNNNSELGDMYSTALMNTNSVQEAEALKEKLDKIYNQNSEIIYSYKQYSNSSNKLQVILPELFYSEADNYYAPSNIYKKWSSIADGNLDLKQIYKISNNIYYDFYLSNNTNNEVKNISELLKLY